MKKMGVVSLLLMGLSMISLRPASAAADTVVVLEVQGVINPLTVQYLERGLKLAEDQDAQALIITMDTPGGLESSMREIVQLLLDADLPTVVYVMPDGARATSAGMFLLMASDVAAMAPATHVGAAHPVPLGSDIGDVMEEKVVSDAAALVRSVALARGRNSDWAERAVRENLSITAAEAVELDVIDFIAADLDDLLRQLDGREIGNVVLQTSASVPTVYSMNFAESFFHIITNPNVAYLLLSLGTLLLLAELADPGLSVAGIGSVVAFVIAFLALGSLPVNWAGIGLLVLAVIFFLAGLLTDTEAIVSVAGLVPFLLGSLLLFTPFTPSSPAVPEVRVSLWLIGLMAFTILAFTYFVLRAVLAASRRTPRAGAQKLVGMQGVALTDINPTGQVRVDLQDWSAVAEGDGIKAGEPVNVTGISGVRLHVDRSGNNED